MLGVLRVYFQHGQRLLHFRWLFDTSETFVLWLVRPRLSSGVDSRLVQSEQIPGGVTDVSSLGCMSSGSDSVSPVSWNSDLEWETVELYGRI